MRPPTKFWSHIKIITVINFLTHKIHLFFRSEGPCPADGAEEVPSAKNHQLDANLCRCQAGWAGVAFLKQVMNH